MARETIIRLKDDLDGTDADETIVFGFRGTDYEIDLSARNAAALERALTKYMDAGRRVSASRSRRGTTRPSRGGAKTDLAVIRAWARENGYQVSERGRIAQEIRDAYEQWAR